MLYLQSPDIIPTGIPTYGPPSIEDIITINPLELAGTPLMSIVKYDARIPRMEHMMICQIMILWEVSPFTIAWKLLDLVAMYVKIKITDNILNISRNGAHNDSPLADLLK